MGLGLGVREAIRNYCGTIDKRRLRGCTTEKFSLLLYLLLDLSFLFSSFFLPSFPPPQTSPPLHRSSFLIRVFLERRLSDSSICNVQDSSLFRPVPTHLTPRPSFIVLTPLPSPLSLFFRESLSSVQNSQFLPTLFRWMNFLKKFK